MTMLGVGGVDLFWWDVEMLVGWMKLTSRKIRGVEKMEVWSFCDPNCADPGGLWGSHCGARR